MRPRTTRQRITNNKITNNAEMQAGFTLVEILATMGIFLLVFVVATQFAANIFQYDSIVQNTLTGQGEAANALDTISSQLRSMSDSSVGGYPIANAGTSSLTFFDDLYDNGTKEEVLYSLSQGTLDEGVIVPTGNPLTYNTGSEKVTQLVHNVTNTVNTPLFQYFDGNYAGTSSPLTQPVSVSAVRLIEVTLTVDADPNRSPSPQTLTTEVSLRNLKSNL